ncbi:MAG: hypothetical protein ACAI44_28345, partial [Candidatus Sericytochromatia bacterium]
STRPSQGGTSELQDLDAFLARLRSRAQPLLSLERLDRAAIEQLIGQKLQTQNVPPALTELVFQQAEGHPFFSEELVYALREAGHLSIEDGSCRLQVAPERLRALALPGTVEGLILSRLDRLEAADQLVLKVASVIGRNFEVRVLQEVYPVPGERGRLPAAVNQLELQGLLQTLSQQTERSYTFRHNLTHQAIYQVLLPTQRQDLHRRVARWYESSFRHELSPFFGLLAHHWSQALDSGKSLLYCRKAGRHALENGLYQEAVYFLEQARSQMEAEGQPDASLWRDLGEACYGLGRIPESRTYLERAAAAMGWPVPPLERLKRELGRELTRQLGHRIWISRARDPLRQERLRQASQTLERLGQIYYLSNDKIRGLYNALLILNLCQQAGPSPQLARACANIALMASAMGRTGIARSYRRQALELAARFHDPGSLAWAEQVTAMSCLGQAQWQEASDSLKRALGLYERVHDSRHRNESLGLLSLVNFLQGHWQESKQLSTQSRALAHAREDRDLESRALLALGKLALFSAQDDEAAKLLHEALKLQPQPSQLRIQALALLLRLELKQDPQAARQRADEMAAIQQLTHESITAFDLEVLTAQVEFALFSQTQAEAALQTLENFARRFALGQPRALLYRGWWLARNGRRLAATKLWQQTRVLATELGMPFEAGLAEQLLANAELVSLPLLGNGFVLS